MSSTSTKTVKNPNAGGNRTFFFILAAIVAILAIGIVGIVIKQSNIPQSAWNISRMQTPENLQVSFTEEDNGQGQYATFYTNEDVNNIISVFADPQCPLCHQFEKTNGRDLATLVETGDTAMRVHIMSFLDDNHGNTYSRLVSKSFVLLAQNDTPDVAWKFYNSIWENQPSDTMTKEEMSNVARAIGAKQENIDGILNMDVESTDNVNLSNMEALEISTGEIGTPNVFVNGINQPNALSPNFFREILENGTPEGAEVKGGINTKTLLKITDPSLTNPSLSEEEIADLFK